MSQTAYAEQGKSLDGMKADLGPDYVESFAAEVKLPFGRLTVRGTSKEAQAKLPTSAALITNLKSLLGVVLQSHAIENPKDGLEPGHPISKTAPILEKGRVYVKVEDQVTVDSDVYARFSGGNPGLFRSDSDGDGDAVAQVSTMTVDTIVNATVYTTIINGTHFSYLSDADATDVEIVAGLRAAIDAGAEPVTSADGVGTDDYTLTADVAGVPFIVEVDARQSIVATTANGLETLNAALVPNARWKEGADADGFAKLELY